MSVFTPFPRRFGQILAGLALVFGALFAVTASAQDVSVTRVEESWELVVSDPNSYNDAPQVTCVVSPLGNLQSVHATLELNHRTLPAFASGGLQLQVWNGERLLGYRSNANEASLSLAGETITWTQAMEIREGTLTFEILNGQSLAWGQFGAEGSLKLVLPTALSNLNDYRPETSAANSGVGFAGNRVQSLKLKAVRFFLSTGEQRVSELSRTVYPNN